MEASSLGLEPVKVNCVVRVGVNESEVPKLVRKFRGTGVIVRFIEFMDVGEYKRVDSRASSAKLGDSGFPFKDFDQSINQTLAMSLLRWAHLRWIW